MEASASRTCCACRAPVTTSQSATTTGSPSRTRPSTLHGRTLGEVDSHDGTRRLLIAVRSGEVELNPVRDRTIGPGDMLVFAGRDEDLAREL